MQSNPVWQRPLCWSSLGFLTTSPHPANKETIYHQHFFFMASRKRRRILNPWSWQKKKRLPWHLHATQALEIEDPCLSRSPQQRRSVWGGGGPRGLTGKKPSFYRKMRSGCGLSMRLSMRLRDDSICVSVDAFESKQKKQNGIRVVMFGNGVCIVLLPSFSQSKVSSSRDRITHRCTELNPYLSRKQIAAFYRKTDSPTCV